MRTQTGLVPIEQVKIGDRVLSQDPETGELAYKVVLDTTERPASPMLRITVGDVLEYLASGMTIAEVLADFSELTQDDIFACLAFAADREKGTMIVPPAA